MYGNIRKTIHFLMSCNIGEILVVLAFLLRTPTPLLPAQLLWVNLVTDSLPALALGSDPPQGDVMRRPPTARTAVRFQTDSVLRWRRRVMIGALALLAFTVGRVFFDADPMQPAVGARWRLRSLSLSQLVHSYNMRSTGSVLGRGMFKNRGLNISFFDLLGMDGGRGRVSASGGAVWLRTADLDTVGHRGNPCFAASADLRNAEKDTFSHGKVKKYDFRCEKASYFQQIACYFLIISRHIDFLFLFQL